MFLPSVLYSAGKRLQWGNVVQDAAVFFRGAFRSTKYSVRLMPLSSEMVFPTSKMPASIRNTRPSLQCVAARSIPRYLKQAAERIHSFYPTIP